MFVGANSRLDLDPRFSDAILIFWEEDAIEVLTPTFVEGLKLEKGAILNSKRDAT